MNAANMAIFVCLVSWPAFGWKMHGPFVTVPFDLRKWEAALLIPKCGMYNKEYKIWVYICNSKGATPNSVMLFNTNKRRGKDIVTTITCYLGRVGCGSFLFSAQEHHHDEKTTYGCTGASFAYFHTYLWYGYIYERWHTLPSLKEGGIIANWQ